MLPLLRTKTTIPLTRAQRIKRTRLFEQLNAGMQRVLTLVVAPAGFGKTTLVTEWARNASMPVAWLSLETTDHAPERFLNYVLHALQQIFPQVGQTALAMLHGGQPITGDAIQFSLLNDLSETPGEFALVLDDYHTVDGPDINVIVQALLEHCPAQMHLVIATRTQPEISLARLRATDQVIEIHASDLRFNEEEIHAFLEQMGIHLSAQQLAQLNRSAEGWAVGLQLAGLALARQPFDWNIPAGQVHIFEYMAQEVLRRESPEVQDFLKASALFDRFCLSVVQYALRNTHEEIASILLHVERANLFLVPLDASGTWFRYHALFTEFLRQQISVEEARGYYHAASLWFEENNLLDEAIRYATHAGDFERAANLIELHYIDVIQRGEQSALMEWIRSLPAALMESRPRLWLARGWSNVISLNSTEARACAEKVEALIPLDGEESNQRLRGEARALRIMTGIFAGEVISADEISKASILLAKKDDFLHSLLHFNLGVHHVMLGNTALALDAFAETLRLTKDFNNPLVTIVAYVQTGEVRQMRGALGLSERTFQQAIRYACDTLGEHTVLLGMPYISYADLLREQNRFDEAIRYAEQGIAYCRVWQPVASMDGEVALARILAAQGHWQDAFVCLEHAMQVAEKSISVLDDTFIAVHLVRLHLLRGDLPKARHFIQVFELEELGKGIYFYLSEMTRLVLLRAKVAALQTDPKQAPEILEALSTLIVEAEKRERVTSVIEASVLSARAFHFAAQHAQAIETLSHALTLGAQSGYVRIFADEGRPLLALLEQYKDQFHAPHSYVEEILQILRDESSDPQIKPDPRTEGLTRLTRRELDILQLLAAGKSNQEIADERVLTLNTVKKHVGNILSKMGVANRTQAVMLAKKLEWIK